MDRSFFVTYHYIILCFLVLFHSFFYWYFFIERVRGRERFGQEKFGGAKFRSTSFFSASAITNVSSWRSLLESFVAVWKNEIAGKVFFFLFRNSFGYLRLHRVNSSYIHRALQCSCLNVKEKKNNLRVLIRGCKNSTKFAIVKTFFIIRYNEEYFKGTMEKVEN